jgi:hypothetical protein
MRRSWTYLVVTIFAVALVAVAQVFVFEFSSSGRIYCDASAAPDAAHIVLRGMPCRLRLGLIASVYGPNLIGLLLFVQAPAYLYWYVRSRRGGPDSPMSRLHAAPYRRYVLKLGHWSRWFAEIYLYVTGLAVFFLVSFMASVSLSHNAGASYCRYTKGQEPHNFFVQGEPCRLVFSELDKFAILLMAGVAIVHMPVYLCIAIRFVRRHLHPRRRQAFRASHG